MDTPVRRSLSNNDELIIRQGRHPVIEALAEQQRADRFVPNDLYMNDSTDQILVITGPNMGGKSTYLRQAALLVILAQMGSFVPAHMMKFPLADRIFHPHRRIGQPHARPIDVHGRDDGNGADPQFGDPPKSDRSR